MKILLISNYRTFLGVQLVGILKVLFLHISAYFNYLYIYRISQTLLCTFLFNQILYRFYQTYGYTYRAVSTKSD